MDVTGDGSGVAIDEAATCELDLRADGHEIVLDVDFIGMLAVGTNSRPAAGVLLGGCEVEVFVAVAASTFGHSDLAFFVYQVYWCSSVTVVAATWVLPGGDADGFVGPRRGVPNETASLAGGF